MVSTFTPNVQLEEPARGDQVGVWDTPVNGNMTTLDLVVGGIATVPLTNANVVLSAAQYKARNITFTGALSATCAITFPTSFTKSYEVQNLCSGSSAFLIQLLNGVGQSVCIPPGEIVDVVNDGTNIKFKNLGRIGEYCDVAYGAIPNWVAACSVPPYLLCNGTTFSSATYPVLNVLLSGTTLPDARGRARYAFDAGTGRISTVIGAPNTVGGAGGDQLLQVHSHANTATANVTDPGHVHSHGVVSVGDAFQGGINPLPDQATNTGSAVTGITVGVVMSNANAGSGGAQNMPPVYIGGITMIRAA